MEAKLPDWIAGADSRSEVTNSCVEVTLPDSMVPVDSRSSEVSTFKPDLYKSSAEFSILIIVSLTNEFTASK